MQKLPIYTNIKILVVKSSMTGKKAIGLRKKP